MNWKKYLSAQSRFLSQAFFTVTLLTSIVACSYQPQTNSSNKVITFLNASGKKTELTVQIASTPEQWSRGLQNIKSMATNNGMLFVFPGDELHDFWMKDTYIPLDLIFINSKKEIVSIHQNAIPQDETHISSQYLVKYVIEVNAGFCLEHEITLTTKVLL